MINGFQLIKKDESKLSEVLEYFNQEYESGREEIKIKGNLSQSMTQLPALYEIRFAQLQELEAILAFYNNKLNGIKGSLYREFQEKSKRSLTSTDLKQYVEGDVKTLAIQTIINEIALVRNKFVSLTKGFETKNYMLTNLTKLHIAGLDSVEL